MTTKSGETKRLDAAVRDRFSWSWGRARDRIRSGKISIDGRTVLDPGFEVPEGAAIEYAESAPRPRPEDRLLPPSALVHLDREIAVVDKPSGLLTVPWERGDRPTLQHLLRAVLSRRGLGAAVHVVHRLDRNTSGLLVFARTLAARDGLKEQFRRHAADRRYVALVHGAVSAAATLESHLVLDRGDGLRGSRERAPARFRGRLGAGKEAVTHVEVLERLPGASLVACRLETGRTNQIRIHLSEAGHPLVGETTYLRDYVGAPIAAPRLMLHAAELGFVHPGTLEPVRFASGMPPEMSAVVEGLRRAPPPGGGGLRYRWKKGKA